MHTSGLDHGRMRCRIRDAVHAGYAEPMGRVIMLLLFALLVTVSARAQQGGRIAGRITVTKPDNPEDAVRRFLLLNRYAVSSAVNNDVLASATGTVRQRLGEKAVVYLEGERLSRGRYAPPSKRPVLDQRGVMFRPQVLPVLVGTTVDFPNSDNLFHNVFSYSEAKEFDLGRYPKGSARQVTFEDPGIVRIYCDIHAHMNATILVLDNPYFVTPDDDGTFAIEGVPPGEYTLKFWYARELVTTRTITVRDSETVNADFQF